MLSGARSVIHQCLQIPWKQTNRQHDDIVYQVKIQIGSVSETLCGSKMDQGAPWCETVWAALIRMILCSCNRRRWDQGLTGSWVSSMCYSGSRVTASSAFTQTVKLRATLSWTDGEKVMSLMHHSRRDKRQPLLQSKSGPTNWTQVSLSENESLIGHKEMLNIKVELICGYVLQWLHTKLYNSSFYQEDKLNLRTLLLLFIWMFLLSSSAWHFRHPAAVRVSSENRSVCFIAAIWWRNECSQQISAAESETERWLKPAGTSEAEFTWLRGATCKVCLGKLSKWTRVFF